jgi:beta-glucosidase
MIYNHKPSAYFHKYADEKNTPLYPFGFGLSYTKYSYGSPKLSCTTLKDNEEVIVTVEVTNSGNMDGEEIVQLYIRDKVSSATRPVKELKGYQRVALKVGETKTVSFTINAESLAFYDINMTYCVEPGEFLIMTGSSSKDKDLKSTILEVNNRIEL